MNKQFDQVILDQGMHQFKRGWKW